MERGRVNPLPRLIYLENRQLPFHPPDTAEWAEQLYFVPMYNFEFCLFLFYHPCAERINNTMRFKLNGAGEGEGVTPLHGGFVLHTPTALWGPAAHLFSVCVHSYLRYGGPSPPPSPLGSAHPRSPDPAVWPARCVSRGGPGRGVRPPKSRTFGGVGSYRPHPLPLSGPNQNF